MTAPIRSMPEYEIYRVVTDYEALQDGFIDRIEDLNTTMDQIDVAGGMTRGNTQRLLTKNEGTKRKDRPSPASKRTFGWESLAKELKGTGMALVLVIDDDRFAPLKAELMARKRPRKPPNAGSAKPAWLFTKKKAREMGKKRFALMTESERKRHQRKAGKASGKARRRKAQKSGALLAQVCRPSSTDGTIAASLECQMVLDQAEAARPQPPITDAACGAAHARPSHAIP